MEKPDSTDAGLIGLSLMVFMPESYLQYLEEKAISINIENKVYDSHSIFDDADHAIKNFLIF